MTARTKQRKQTITPVQTAPYGESYDNLFFSVTRKAFLANLGAWAMAQEESQKFANHLVERGEKWEKKAQSWLKGLRRNSQKRFASTQDELSNRMSNVLGSMALPTKQDVAELDAKIAQLMESVATLEK